jgi:hypothetical protein
MLCAVAHATNVSGIIGTNTVWDTSGSPYVVTGNNLLVDTLTTLTIRPGVVVKLDTARCILVKGILDAIGTATDSILFTKSGTAPWARLWFEQRSKAHFKYCRIEYANNTAVYGADADSIYIGFCTVSNNTAYGAISILGGKAFVTNSAITNNSVTDNYSNCGSGVAINGDFSANGASASITSNTFSYNTSVTGGGGIMVGDAAVTITGNTISHNTSFEGGGINISGSGNAADTAIISNNSITYNTTPDGMGGGILLYGDGTGGQLIVTVSNNIISNNSAGSGGGIDCYGGFVQNFAAITSNTITNNSADHGGAINITNGSPTIRFNTITSASDSVIIISGPNVGNVLIRTNNISASDFALCNRTPNKRDLRYNWWNTTNADTINAKIYDFFDDFTTGMVIYKPFLMAPFSDTMAPSAPLNLAATLAKDSSFVITWTNPSDASGIAEYYYKVNSPPGSAFDTTGTFHASPDTVVSQGGSLYVWLVDSSGNMNYQNADSVLLNASAIRVKGRASGNPVFSLTFTPSSSGTTINYGIPERTFVNLTLYDISGRLVKSIYSGIRESGYYTADLRRNELGPGAYFMRIETASCTAAKKFVFLR